MANFWLIQRGTFKENGTHLIGKDSAVSLDYMGSSEFEYDAIPRAFRRMMYHLPKYDVFHTGIYTPEHEEMMVFCKESSSQEILLSIKQFIETPYILQEYSELEKVPKAKKEDTDWRRRQSNFWWCIDINPNGDWIAFLEPHLKILTEAIQNDYQNWWLAKPLEQRNEEYKNSLYL